MNDKVSSSSSASADDLLHQQVEEQKHLLADRQTQLQEIRGLL